MFDFFGVTTKILNAKSWEKVHPLISITARGPKVVALYVTFSWSESGSFVLNAEIEVQRLMFFYVLLFSSPISSGSKKRFMVPKKMKPMSKTVVFHDFVISITMFLCCCCSIYNFHVICCVMFNMILVTQKALKSRSKGRCFLFFQ